MIALMLSSFYPNSDRMIVSVCNNPEDSSDLLDGLYEL